MTSKKRERSAYNRAWRLANIELVRERAREYRERNKDKIERYHREWHARNPGKAQSYAATPKARANRRAYHRDRYQNDAAFRERARAGSRRQRERIRTDPTLRARERAATAKYQRTTKGQAARRRRDLAQFGVTLEQYNALHEQQKGLCAICGQPEKWQGKNRTAWLTVDHCHETSRVRGLLCRSCNRGLGLLGDTPASIDRALRYLTT